MADLTRIPAKRLHESELRGTRVVHGCQVMGASRWKRLMRGTLHLSRIWDPAASSSFSFRAGLELVAARPKVFSLEQPGELAWEVHA